MTAGDLPAEIRLDDRYAMSPESAISGQDDVVVVARLSRSGSVNPQPGDWEGRVEAALHARRPRRPQCPEFPCYTPGADTPNR